MVGSILRNCLSDVEELRQLLEKSRVRNRGSSAAVGRMGKAMVVFRDEKRVEKVFQRLERDKGSLALCIQEIDSWALPFLTADA